MKRARVQRARFGGEEIIVLSTPLHVEDGRPARGTRAKLTPAEHEIARMIRAGLSNAEIAAARGRSVRTIANQVASLLQKLHVASRHLV